MLHDDEDVLVIEPSLSKPFNPFFLLFIKKFMHLRKPKHIKLNLVSRSPANVNMYYFTV